MAVGQIDWEEIFCNSPSPDREADVCFASPSLALGTVKALSGDERRQGPLSSPISRLSVVVAMGQIGIDWKEMFRNSPSLDHGADVCFASPSSSSTATRVQAGADVGRHEGVIGRQAAAGSSLLPDLRTVGGGDDGADQDRLEGDISQLTLPDYGADVCFASPSLVSVATRVFGAAKALSDDERRRGCLSSPI